MPRENTALAIKMVEWSKRHGRKNLPWQHTSDPYRIWLSEIMLQQTQVVTVIDYFERFIRRFPTIQALAGAAIDDVLALWSGLGYYARARNLHRAAKIIATEHDGIFPNSFDQVIALPGIGKSTAGAILAFSDNQRHPILDGNVKRVLCRYYAIEGYPASREVESELWRLADANTPLKDVARYTQAIMDLGATVCTRKNPDCPGCPVLDSCAAYKQNIQSRLPTPRPKKSLPTRQTRMLMISNHQSQVLLEKRPPAGIWGGLWSLPECSLDADLEEHCRHSLGIDVAIENELEQIKHSFTHYHLVIHPHQLKAVGFRALDDACHNWFEITQVSHLGLPKPVKLLLDQLGNEI